jgi:hypothetical protein
MDRAELAGLAAGELAEGIGALHASLVATHARLIDYLAAYDATGAWKDDGATSLANWLVARLGVSYRSATEWVDTARALPELPALSEAFAEGRLPVESVVAAAALASPDSDDRLTEEALRLPAEVLKNQLRREQATAAQRAQPERHERASLKWWFAPDGWCRFSGYLPPDLGAAVIAAVERAEGDDAPDPATGDYDPPDTRHAHGLGRLASTALAADADADRACVVVHVDVETLMSGQGSGTVGGMAVPAPVIDRLACDCRLETHVHGPYGLVGIGTATRQVPAWLLRHLHHRDGGCRFPGCGRRSHLHAHHIVFWTRGGPTDATNLCLLCPAHHVLVHDRGWSLRGNPEPGPGPASTLTFYRPDGSAFEPRTQPVAAPAEWPRWLPGGPAGAGSPGGGGSPPGGADPPLPERRDLLALW